MELDSSHSKQVEDSRYFAAGTEHQEELARRRIGEAECDPLTVRYLADVGVGEGWRCLDVGAGAGSIVRWLSSRVGPDGAVVAADIDTRFLEDLDLGNVEVRRLDITQDDLEADSYDLIHCRWLLMHLDDPAAVLRRMARALRPGGWLLVEEADFRSCSAIDGAHPLANGFNAATQNRTTALRDSGIMDLHLGGSLPTLLADAGLADVSSEGVARIVQGGTPWSLYFQKTWKLVDDGLIENGVLTEADVAATRHAYDNPTFRFREHVNDAAWGRRPSQTPS
jgi:2-polyprenyl-3-methyl-5-hydroxy-6-metoxy-1,4-benzoquinol methylase